MAVRLRLRALQLRLVLQLAVLALLSCPVNAAVPGASSGQRDGVIASRGGSSVTKLKPDPSAQAPHSTFKRDPQTGRVTGHAQWDAQGNPVQRTDVTGRAHGPVQTPHTHEYGPPNVNPATGRSYPGNEVGVRPATPDEIPAWRR
jgi:hypothetical protein